MGILTKAKYKSLIAEKRRGEEAYKELIAALEEKIEQVYYAKGIYADTSFELDEIWFDYDKNLMYLDYTGWIGEAAHDQLTFDIDEFFEADFEEAANAVKEEIKQKRAKHKSAEEQLERDLLERLKQKYEG